MHKISCFLFALAVVAIVAGGCNNTTDVPPDTEAPIISLVSPEVGDTVGTTEVSIVASTSDNLAVAKVEFYIDGQLQTTVTNPPYEATVQITSFSDGAHKAMAKAYDDAGNVGTSVEITFVKGIRSVDVVKRYVLAEITTSANCTSCAPQNEAFRTAVMGNSVYQERVISVKYHGWFPRATDSIWLATQSWAKPRIDYLFGVLPLSFPKAWVDGNLAGSNATGWIQMMQNELLVAPEAKIELSKTDGAGTVDLTIKLTGMNATSYSDLRLHTIVTEDEINYNDGNAEFEHWDVMCEMIPSADGDAISMTNGQSQSYTRQITVKQGWHKEKLNAVVFVQSKGSMKVLQAAKISLK